MLQFIYKFTINIQGATFLCQSRRIDFNLNTRLAAVLVTVHQSGHRKAPMHDSLRLCHGGLQIKLNQH